MVKHAQFARRQQKFMVTIRTCDTCVRKQNLFYYSNGDIHFGKLHLAPPKDGSRGNEQTHPTDFIKI